MRKSCQIAGLALAFGIVDLVCHFGKAMPSRGDELISFGIYFLILALAIVTSAIENSGNNKPN